MVPRIVFCTRMVSRMDEATRLALAARDGDRAALDELVGLTYRAVWQFNAKTLDRADADDVTQRTFERAIRALPRFRGESAALTWLLGVARHECLEHLRRAANRNRLAERVGAGEMRAPDPTGRVEVDELLQQLDFDRRSAFVLTQVLGYRYEETAHICDCPVGTIRSRVARARSELLALIHPGITDRDSRHG